MPMIRVSLTRIHQVENVWKRNAGNEDFVTGAGASRPRTAYRSGVRVRLQKFAAQTRNPFPRGEAGNGLPDGSSPASQSEARSNNPPGCEGYHDRQMRESHRAQLEITNIAVVAQYRNYDS